MFLLDRLLTNSVMEESGNQSTVLKQHIYILVRIRDMDPGAYLETEVGRVEPFGNWDLGISERAVYHERCSGIVHSVNHCHSSTLHMCCSLRSGQARPEERVMNTRLTI
ncbi:hypothetical protein PGT21_035202 [Puccinia graminis f. sp. tritici]|uniref:Uncharacterized protein n=1 Tax=Puccinia graminis f. sp. tritici TaxID=56615 RepID=A0A5B0P1N0_PUCGR|nr:hypothetical protein PGT21_035202 [Puccinia graminis f. sp. tritici]